MADIFVAHGAFRLIGRKMAGDTVSVYGETPCATVILRFRLLMAAIAGFFFMTNSAILAIPSSTNSVAFSAPCEVVTFGCFPLVAFFTRSFLVVADQAELHVLL